MPWRNPATATEGIVWGRVIDANTGLYVDDATVTVTGGPTVKTDGNGYYIATLVPATAGGTAHSTTVSKTGMTSQTTNAIALAGDVVRYDLTLNAAVNTAPSITTQPQSQTVIQGANATFSVTASGTTSMSYQWRFNATNLLSGATTTAYTRSNAQPADAGSYSVVVTNSFGSVTSTAAMLAVNSSPTPPGITNQPQSLSLIAGQNATFSVTAGGSSPLSYQWSFNGTSVGNATASSYTRANVQAADAGTYLVVVTNAFGAVTSSPATLAVSMTLTAAATTGGTVSKNPDQTSYSPNSTVVLTATTNTGYAFTGWSGDASGTANPLSVQVTTNKVITANFASIVTDIILDNTNSAVTLNGVWTTGTYPGFYGQDYRWASTLPSGTSNAVYTPNISTPGYYDVFLWYVQGGNRSTIAPWSIVYIRWPDQYRRQPTG